MVSMHANMHAQIPTHELTRQANTRAHSCTFYTETEAPRASSVCRIFLQGELVVLLSTDIKEARMGEQIGFRAEKVLVVMSLIPNWLDEVMH